MDRNTLAIRALAVAAMLGGLALTRDAQTLLVFGSALAAIAIGEGLTWKGRKNRQRKLPPRRREED